MSHVRYMAVFLFIIGAATTILVIVSTDLLGASSFPVGMGCGDNELCTVHGYCLLVGLF
jgi:hypothetical protein